MRQATVTTVSPAISTGHQERTARASTLDAELFSESAEILPRLYELRAELTPSEKSLRTAVDRAIASRQAYESHLLARRAAEQSDVMRKVTCWAAVLLAPTAVGTVYGMNFEYMPELHWQFGYPVAVAAMLASAAVILAIFRAKRWL